MKNLIVFIIALIALSLFGYKAEAQKSKSPMIGEANFEFGKIVVGDNKKDSVEYFFVSNSDTIKGKYFLKHKDYCFYSESVKHYWCPENKPEGLEKNSSYEFYVVDKDGNISNKMVVYTSEEFISLQPFSEEDIPNLSFFASVLGKQKKKSIPDSLRENYVLFAVDNNSYGLKTYIVLKKDTFDLERIYSEPHKVWFALPITYDKKEKIGKMGQEEYSQFEIIAEDNIGNKYGGTFIKSQYSEAYSLEKDTIIFEVK